MKILSVSLLLAQEPNIAMFLTLKVTEIHLNGDFVGKDKFKTNAITVSLHGFSMIGWSNCLT